MSKTAILTCSNAGLDYLDYPKDITILRSVIHFNGDESFNDYIDMDAKTFYERIKANPNDIPKTSYVALGEMIETFNRLKESGYEVYSTAFEESSIPMDQFHASKKLALVFGNEVKGFPFTLRFHLGIPGNNHRKDSRPLRARAEAITRWGRDAAKPRQIHRQQLVARRARDNRIPLATGNVINQSVAGIEGVVFII